MNKSLYIIIVFSALFTSVNGQFKVGQNPKTLNPSAILELESDSMGLLLPRVALTNTDSATPLKAHVMGMTVYNTATVGSGDTAVTPGYYYNTGAKWIKIADAAASSKWTNDKNNSLVNLTNLSDGATARAAGKEFVITDTGRVGIGTTMPQASLDIRAKNHEGQVTSQDGVLVPRVNALDSSGSINGQLVYLIADSATFTKGFHYWDGAAWTRIGSGGIAGTKTLKIPAEYPGAVLVSSGVGIGDISGDYVGSENVYLWETIETTNQTIDVSLQIHLPNDFKSWPTAANLSLNGTNSVIQSVSGATAAGTGTASVTLSGTNNPGDIIRVVIRLTANAGTATAGTITLSYN